MQCWACAMQEAPQRWGDQSQKAQEVRHCFYLPSSCANAHLGSAFLKHLFHRACNHFAGGKVVIRMTLDPMRRQGAARRKRKPRTRAEEGAQRIDYVIVPCICLLYVFEGSDRKRVGVKAVALNSCMSVELHCKSGNLHLHCGHIYFA